MLHTTVDVEEGVLAATVDGSGETLLVVQTALSVDDLVPLMSQPVLQGYRLITFNRRGYGDSRKVPWEATIAQDARDCLAVLTALDALPAHVLGASFSAAVAMELAASAPSAVRTLTVVEPPPVLTPAGPQFWAANAGLVEAYERDGAEAAVEAFMRNLSGPGWRASLEQLVPGYAERMLRDAATFFRRDIPALASWHYGNEQASRVVAPVLYVGGTISEPWFLQTRAWVESLFRNVTSRMIDGAGHDLPLTHPQALAETVAEFLAAW